MRHYLFLSRAHAVRKFVQRSYDQAEVATGWHSWRADLTAEAIVLPPESWLRSYDGDGTLDAARPWRRHVLDGARRPGSAEGARQ
jgi:hypothetical protein